MKIRLRRQQTGIRNVKNHIMPLSTLFTPYKIMGIWMKWLKTHLYVYLQSKLQPAWSRTNEICIQQRNEHLAVCSTTTTTTKFVIMIKCLLRAFCYRLQGIQNIFENFKLCWKKNMENFRRHRFANDTCTYNVVWYKLMKNSFPMHSSD